MDAVRVTATDLASGCALELLSADSVGRGAALGGIRLQSRAVREARELRMRKLREAWAAARESGLLAKLQRVFSGLAAALTAIAALGCPAAGAAHLAVTALAGGCRVGGGAADWRRARGQAGAARAGLAAEEGREALRTCLAALDRELRAEGWTAERLRELQDVEHRLIRRALGAPEAAP